MFAKLREHCRKHGGCLVPQDYKEDPLLGRWVMSQRSRHDELDSDRISRLESIGFIWEPLDHQWEDIFAKLEQYCLGHGDCLVPRSYTKDPPLGIWVTRQRFHCDKLDSKQISRLESIGFVWDALDQKWEELQSSSRHIYRQEYGDCLVPRSYKKNPSLGLWVVMQLTQRDKLNSDRKDRLDDSIGFVWQAKRSGRAALMSL
jgi:hypothetical protein